MTISATTSDFDCALSGGRRSPSYVRRRLGREVVPDKLYSRGSDGLSHTLHLSSSGSASNGVIVHHSDEQVAFRVGDRGSGCYAGEGSNRRSSPFSRLLQPPLCSSEEGRRLAPSDQSEADQQGILGSSSLSDGHDEGRCHASQSRGLGGIGGSERRIFSYPPQPSVPAFPPVRLEQEAVPVPSCSFRPFDRSVHLHDGNETYSGVSTIPRNSSHLLLGRHSRDRQVKGRVRTESPDRPDSPSRVGLPHQLEEIQPLPEPTIPLSRPSLGHNSGANLLTSDEAFEAASSSFSHAAVASDLSPASSPTGSHDCVDPSGAADSSSRASPSAQSSGGLLDTPAQ